MSKLSLFNIVALADAFRLSLETEELTVNLAGLEPTLWAYGRNDIADLVSELSARGYKVEMTTNGSRLRTLSPRLLKAGLSKCRVSIHNFDPIIYQRITGRDKLADVIVGVTENLQHGIPTTINRTLLRGFTDDLPRALEFIQAHKMTLKLYDLWRVPNIASTWDKYYIPWQEVVEQYIEPISVSATEKRNEFHRNRVCYELQGGGNVEVKVFSQQQHNAFPTCRACLLRDRCSETFGSYIHVFANGHLTFCNLREDIHVDLIPALSQRHPVEKVANLLASSMEEIMGVEWRHRILAGRIRLYINEECNFRCSFLTQNRQLWCLSSVRSKTQWQDENALPDTSLTDFLFRNEKENLRKVESPFVISGDSS